MTTIARALNGAPITRPGFAAAPLQSAVLAIRRAVCRRGTRRALGRLSDHTLKDIGLHRSEIDSLARALADRQPDPTRAYRQFVLWL
jgi:uncharacterized protein YjiS (DUF1127 family)